MSLIPRPSCSEALPKRATLTAADCVVGFLPVALRRRECFGLHAPVQNQAEPSTPWSVKKPAATYRLDQRVPQYRHSCQCVARFSFTMDKTRNTYNDPARLLRQRVGPPISRPTPCGHSTTKQNLTLHLLPAGRDYKYFASRVACVFTLC